MEGEFVRCRGRHVGIAGTPENPKMGVRGLSGIKRGVRGQKSEGFSGEPVHKICCSVNGLNPVNRREARLKQKGMQNVY